MSLENDLQAWLLAQTGVSAVIGTRLFRLVADQDVEKPFAVLLTQTTEPQRNLIGPDGEAIARMQIACWGDTADQADDTRAAIRIALRSLEHSIVAARMPMTIGSTRIRDVSDTSDQELYDEDVRERRRLLEFTVRFEE